MTVTEIGTVRRRSLVAGGSRGLGLAIATALAADGDAVTILSSGVPTASTADSLNWIRCDLSDPEAIARAAETLRGEPWDCVVYNAGIWERPDYADTSPDELARVVDVSLSGAVLLIQALLPEIRAGAGNLVAIGSTSGLENEGTAALAYTAAKFGLRGAAESWRENLRLDGVRVTCINIGSMASDHVLGDSAEALLHHQSRRIPVDDVVDVIRCIRRLSPASCLKSITMPAQLDTDG